MKSTGVRIGVAIGVEELTEAVRLVKQENFLSGVIDIHPDCPANIVS